MVLLHTDRLTLRDIAPDDAPFILRLLNEPSFLRFIGDRGVRTLEDAQRYIAERIVASYDRHGYGLWLVELKATGKPIGISGLVKRDALPDADIGFAFVPEAWAQGYAFESTVAVKRHALEVLRLRRLLGVTNPDNAGSIRILEKLGLGFSQMLSLSPNENEVRLYSLEVSSEPIAMVHAVDGTYELFRHFYGARRFSNGEDKPFAAVLGVLGTVLQMYEGGATHLGVATDHVIESFRNALWPGYKTGDGIEPALAAQFLPLEQGLAALGVPLWAMTDLEADDGLASAAALSAATPEVSVVSIWTPDKDLAQCVVGDRVVQVDRKSGKIRNEAGVREKFRVDPARIPDFLALVGDSADGYPGIPGIGAVTAARLIARHGPIEDFPSDVLGANRELALLFKKLATLRTDASLFAHPSELRWGGPRAEFAAWCAEAGAPRLLERAERAFAKATAQPPV